MHYHLDLRTKKIIILPVMTRLFLVALGFFVKEKTIRTNKPLETPGEI
jgi:hypothetical protein